MICNDKKRCIFVSLLPIYEQYKAIWKSQIGKADILTESVYSTLKCGRVGKKKKPKNIKIVYVTEPRELMLIAWENLKNSEMNFHPMYANSFA